MAPQADLVLCGLGDWLSTSNIQDCIKEIFDYAKSVRKPAVVSISLGNPLGLHDGSEGVCKTVNELTKNGTEEGRVVVISSSNAAANCQSIIKPLNKANADADGYELKTVLGASKTNTGRADLPVMYSDNYYIYADDYKKFDVDHAIVDIRTGEFVDLTHLKYIDTNNQVQKLETKYVMGYNDKIPMANGGNAYVYMIYFRPQPAYLDDANYRLVLLLKGSHDGQTIKMICNGDNAAEPCFSAPEGGYNFLANGYTRGNGELTTSTSICSDAVISIGSYITRDTWTDYNGNNRNYLKSYVTDKMQVVGEISDFSSYGVDDNGKPRPTAIAPGQGIISAGSNWDKELFFVDQPGEPNPANTYDLIYLCQNVKKNNRSNWYILSQGTSMACPVAAGIVALWMQAKPTLTVNEIKDILQNTCVNDEWTNNTANIPSGNKVPAGYGKINALAGLKRILGTDGIETISADGHREATPATMYSVDAPVYNMMGQRVSQSQKGLVIYKGRKYLNK